jgi:hypothetical protein
VQLGTRPLLLRLDDQPAFIAVHVSFSLYF